MVVANTNYRFVCVDIGRYGKDCDYDIFERSTLWTSIQINMLKLPSERPLAGTESPNVQYFCVEDEGFALNRNTYTSTFDGSNLSVKKSMYKYLMRRAPWYVECAFGILSNK
jgi:hypothetical protein